MNDEEIKNLKINKGGSRQAFKRCTAHTEIESPSDTSIERGRYTGVEARDQSARENSSDSNEKLGIRLRYDRIHHEYPGIDERPGYWGIFVRKGS
jgi:hypothetical protein